MASIPICIAFWIISDEGLLKKYFWYHKTWDELGVEDPEKTMNWELSMTKIPYDDDSLTKEKQSYYIYGR